MPLSRRRWRKQGNQTVFSFPVHVRNWVKAKKCTKIWGRVKEGGRIKREGNLSHPRKRPWRSKSWAASNWIEKVRLFRIVSPDVCFLRNGQPGKEWLHTNVVKWWLWLKYTSNGEKMIFVCVWIFWWEGREGSRGGHLSGEGCGVPRAEKTDPQ